MRHAPQPSNTSAAPTPRNPVARKPSCARCNRHTDRPRTPDRELDTTATVLASSKANTGHAANPSHNLATNPCPCGNHGVRGALCECPPSAIRRYRARLSGPLLDRIDIEMRMTRVTRVPHSRGRTSSADARERVRGARERAARRLRETPWTVNAEIDGAWLRQGPHAPTSDVRAPLDAALERGLLTLRAYDRVLRVAWSVADLAGHDRLTGDDIGRALYLKRGMAA
ncbi:MULTISPECIES: ATP-binding protein [Microbacterium]|uniref:magnesium chelatase subunit ChlI family protein n=1 Tax=Microbacterium TaxID=33882 RepID=UPI0022865323|nr:MULTISPECIES: ATP-binding protein [unclassified Microbacterium]